MRITRTLPVAVLAALALAACGGGDGGSAGADSDTIRVGALAVPAGDMLQFVADELAEDAGLTVEWQEFSDYNTPNLSLIHI